METTDILAQAIETAAAFNRTHGGHYLIANKGACSAAVFQPHELDKLRANVHGWFTAKSLFEAIRQRRATHGELVNLGRQLAKVFPVQRRGPTGYYFIGLDQTPGNLS